MIALLVISAAMLILSTGGAVLADPCTATLSYPTIPGQYGSSNAPFVVPVSASCTTYFQNQLYATGSAYDTTSNTALGSASTVLSPVNGGTQFTGQLGFQVPPTSPGDSVQITVSIYNGQGGNLITETSETVPAGPGPQPIGQQIITTTVTVAQYPYANSYPTAYPSTSPPNQPQYYQYPPQYQQQYQGRPPTYYASPGFAQRWNNRNFFNYVVIIAIIAAVIIVTTGLVLIARRHQPPQPVWYPVPPPPPR